MKKPRSDSKLANLPEDTQAEIAAWCKEGLEVGRDMLKGKLAISISVSGLSSWLAWYRRQESLKAGNARVLQMLEWFRVNKPRATQDEIRSATFLNLSLVHGQDPQLQLALLKEQGRDLDRDLIRDKFETETCKKFLLWFRQEKAREIADSGLSNADKIAALRAEYFRDVDTMEASGEVKLPD